MGPDAMASGAMALGDVEDETAAAARDVRAHSRVARDGGGRGVEKRNGWDAFEPARARRRLGDDGSRAVAAATGFGATTTTTTTRASTERLYGAAGRARVRPRGAERDTAGDRPACRRVGGVLPVRGGPVAHRGGVGLARARARATAPRRPVPPAEELRDAPTPELAFEVEKTILSPAKSASAAAAAAEPRRRGRTCAGAVAAARAAAAKASPREAAAPLERAAVGVRAPAPIYESSPSVSSAEEDDDAPTPRTTPRRPRSAPARRARTTIPWRTTPQTSTGRSSRGRRRRRRRSARLRRRRRFPRRRAGRSSVQQRSTRSTRGVARVDRRRGRGPRRARRGSHGGRRRRRVRGGRRFARAARAVQREAAGTLRGLRDGGAEVGHDRGVRGRFQAASRIRRSRGEGPRRRVRFPPRTSLPIEPRDVRKPGRRPGPGLGRISARGWHSCRRRGPAARPGGRRPLARAARVTAGRAPRAAPQTGSRQAHRGRRGGRRQGGLEGTLQAAASQPVCVLRGERRQAGGGRVAADAGVRDAAQRMNTSARGGVVFVSASTTRECHRLRHEKQVESRHVALFEPWNELLD